VPLILRWMWWRVGAGGELAAIVVSIVLAPVLLVGVEEEGIRILLMTLATTLVVIVTSLVGHPTPGESVKEFYRRVKPPGFWGPVARACGEDPSLPLSRLYAGLMATVAGTLSIFCLLVAAGSWLFSSPPPPWFPWRGTWIVALLLASGVLGRAALLARTSAARGIEAV
jgi:hypothetical protein